MSSASRRLHLLTLLMLTTPCMAAAQHDDHGTEQSRRGLGQSYPEAKNLSRHPDWRVYVFARDGFNYLQVNNDRGQVHVVIARAGQEFWALPSGELSARISLPSSLDRSLPDVVPSEIYRSGDFVLLLYPDPISNVWAIEPLL